MWRSTARPLVRLEETIASALLARPPSGADGSAETGAGADSEDARPDRDFAAHVIARICVAAMRSAIIELRGRLAASDGAMLTASAAEPAAAETAGAAAPAARADFEQLLTRAFAIIGAASRA